MLLWELGFCLNDNNLDLLILAQQVGNNLTLGHKIPSLFYCTDCQLLFGFVLLTQLKVCVKGAISEVSDCGIGSDGSDEVEISVGYYFES